MVANNDGRGGAGWRNATAAVRRRAPGPVPEALIPIR